MIHVVCGLIGSGKTTYCHTLKCDIKLDHSTYEYQNQMVYLDQLSRNADREVYYVTCYPSSIELETFMLIDDIEYIWINTDLAKCSTNILERGRADDLLSYKEIIARNCTYAKLFRESNINFKIINLG